eukprot:655538-Prorocentrum_lima.AAC.1
MAATGLSQLHIASDSLCCWRDEKIRATETTLPKKEPCEVAHIIIWTHPTCAHMHKEVCKEEL